MWEFLRSTQAQAVLWVAVLLILTVVGVYAIQFFRNRGGFTRPSASDLLTEFRDLHESGELSQAEFKNIKSVLGTRVQDELKTKDAERTD
jgi:hypothetical protein